MKFKVKPEDFIVEEKTNLPHHDPRGTWQVCLVRKHSVTTLHVQSLLSERLRLPQSEINFPALKDKDACTLQYVSIRGNVPKDLKHPLFSLEFIRRCIRPIKPSDLLGNDFKLVLRGIAQEKIPAIQTRLDELGKYGFPNFFDSQRFGSYVEGEELIGKAILRKDFQKAVELFLYTPMASDIPEIVEFKKQAGQFKGQWQKIMDFAPRSTQRSILAYFKDHPENFKGAVQRINPRLLSLFFSAYQSLLWNKTASAYLEKELFGTRLSRVNVAGMDLPFYSKLDEDLSRRLNEQKIPVAGKKVSFHDSEIENIFDKILAQENLERKNLNLRLNDRVFLGSHLRRLIVIPEKLKSNTPESDELFPGKQKLEISFFLPAGSYATLLLKNLSCLDDPNEV